MPTQQAHGVFDCDMRVFECVWSRRGPTHGLPHRTDPCNPYALLIYPSLQPRVVEGLAMGGGGCFECPRHTTHCGSQPSMLAMPANHVYRRSFYIPFSSATPRFPFPYPVDAIGSACCSCLKLRRRGRCDHPSVAVTRSDRALALHTCDQPARQNHAIRHHGTTRVVTIMV